MNNIVKRFEGNKIKEIKSKNNDTWIYNDIIIPSHIKSIPSIDNVNIVYKDGSETELCGFGYNDISSVKSFTIDEYKNLYSELRDDGKLYWKE